VSGDDTVPMAVSSNVFAALFMGTRVGRPWTPALAVNTD
jgi:hypothetical protein